LQLGQTYAFEGVFSFITVLSERQWWEKNGSRLRCKNIIQKNLPNLKLLLTLKNKVLCVITINKLIYKRRGASLFF
jgi:hypothetical protein